MAVLPADAELRRAGPGLSGARRRASRRPIQKPYFLKVGITEMGQTAAVVVQAA